MDERLHIIIAGEKGKILALLCNRKKLYLWSAAGGAILLFLVLASLFSFSFYTKYHNTSQLLAEINRQTRTQDSIIEDLNLKVAALETDKENLKAEFETEKELLMTNAVSELTERSELIERIVGSIGVKLPEYTKNSDKNSGGPFIAESWEETDDLLFKADKYVNAIRYLPIGRPVSGSISSRFGKRRDPLNSRTSFHEGIDFRGRLGEKIYATADGTVKKAFRNGSYGKHVLINHGNGYTTSFSHMHKILVKKGDKVKRGQVVGLVGNSGRSTGPHLHYEITLNGKPINPYKYLKVARLLKVTSKKTHFKYN
ncbi:M23 family metallopeptidase [Desulforhopalus singaporensis]|uniref:Murein DD-endopeptidase MepM and murein hydrolase activator NlpD, contain LysM domain n=1 Tax=Desulforhopalus singaporensis TaxID=91360 RepID=A0A1H0K393_9BACT|nr:M23 family metallopeptidase [Desulforhopalus singaporensis]SDO50369.1 Murein DD-endopeptidase MepM and murein hydrolase activator NlpD, contain LysM domain [Desulforhopalus singaporensis]